MVVVEVGEEAGYRKISDLLCWHRSRSVRMGLEGERWGRERAGGLLGPCSFVYLSFVALRWRYQTRVEVSSGRSNINSN
jgi:hypothetical protein